MATAILSALHRHCHYAGLGIPLLFHARHTQKDFIPDRNSVLAILVVLTWQTMWLLEKLLSFQSRFCIKQGITYLAHNHLGFALFTEGKIEEAIDHYNKALA